MFIKFKKFALMFVLCMGVFGTTAFADIREQVLQSDINAMLLQYDYYMYNNNYNNLFFFNKEEYSLNSSSINFTKAVYWNYEPSTKKVSKFNAQSWAGVSSCQLTNNYEVSQKFSSEYESDGSIVPPTIAPTVGEAVQTITPQLSKQLKVLLPVGVIVLSIMLGVSLVPRLVHLFL